jgi:hypothetical protein
MSDAMQRAFDAANAVGHEGEAFVAETLEVHGDTVFAPESYAYDMWSERWGRIDVKHDVRSKKTGNFFIETGVECLKTGAIKWSDRSQVDTYAYTDGEHVWMVSTPGLRHLADRSRREAYGPVEPNGKRAVGRLVRVVTMTAASDWCTIAPHGPW